MNWYKVKKEDSEKEYYIGKYRIHTDNNHLSIVITGNFINNNDYLFVEKEDCYMLLTKQNTTGIGWRKDYHFRADSKCTTKTITQLQYDALTSEDTATKKMMIIALWELYKKEL